MSFDSMFSRREFLKGATAFGALSFGMWMGGCEGCWQQIANRPKRRNIANLAEKDPVIVAYKDAVTAMQALPSSDARNWTKQAEIHYNHCPHGNWWFLPWHRAYLAYFERICRKLSGYNDFALPYWNWTTSPAIPAHFWGDGNPLFDSTRFITSSDQADPSWVGTQVIEDILSTTNFYVFASYSATAPRGGTGGGYGELEATPHNNIHGWISGDMGTFMSPLDPVFWCHHNILDCLWWEWNVNRGNPNTNDPDFWNLHFTEFVDEEGAPVDVTVAVVVLMALFDYQFEPCGPNQSENKTSRLSRRQLEAFLKTGAPVKMDFTQRIELKRGLITEVGRPVPSAAKIEAGILRQILQSEGKTSALLTVDGVQVPEKADFYVRVFANKSDATAETPISDPHYAGSFGFFQDLHAMETTTTAAAHPKLGFVVDLTPAMRRLSRAGGLPQAQLDVTLVPVQYEKREATGQQLGIEKLELGIANVK
jgi:tyrosinase